MSDNKGIMVVAEVIEGKLAPITAELLGGGKKLATALGEELSVALVGSGVAALAQEAVSLGADKVYVVDDPALAQYQSDANVAVVEKVAKQALPKIVMMGQTSIGRDMAPRLAFRLGTAASLDCVELAIDPASKQLLQTKPVYGGNAMATTTCATFPQVVTVRIKTMSPSEKNATKQGNIVKIDAGLDPAKIKTRLVKKVAQAVEGIKLEDAEVIVCGGRGIGGPDGFKQLEQLAKLLKGAVGATRPPCDNGWVPEALQIGLTGKIVAPSLYFAVALSGSSQHMSGCSGAKNIIAINKDPKANIIKYARFAVIGDWKKVVPAFTAKVKELVSG